MLGKGPRILPELYSDDLPIGTVENSDSDHDSDENEEDNHQESEEDINTNSYLKSLKKKQKKKKKKKQKTTSDVVKGAAQRFAQQRRELKEQVIDHVMEAALPDMNDFNMDDFVIGKPVPPPPNRCIRCLQFFGCWTVSIHQAIENGSFEQLEKSLTKSALLLEKEKIEKDYIDQINV